MDYIWTPWRYQYITNAIAGEKPACIFCDAAKRTDDATTLVVHRGVSSFAILNRFPYTSGHLMIVPYKHTAEISGVDAATLTEMMHLAFNVNTVNLGMGLILILAARAMQSGSFTIGDFALFATYLGSVAALPRWVGDASFMSVTGETRVLPEDLATTFERVRAALA